MVKANGLYSFKGYTRCANAVAIIRMKNTWQASKRVLAIIEAFGIRESRLMLTGAAWSFADTWRDVFHHGVADHNIKELCRIYVSRSVLC
jgi:hypothetical protein